MLLRPKAALTLGIGACALAAGALFVPGLVREAGAEAGQSTAPVASAGTLLVTLPWGSGEGQVGLLQPAEGLTRGPEALAVAGDGRIAVLDSVNRRVLFLDAAGTPTGSADVPLKEPRFLAVDDARLYVLDCDADRQVVTLDWEGAALELLQLPELNDVVTALFATIDGPCVEVAHESVFLLTGGSEPESAAYGDGAASQTDDTGDTGRLGGRLQAAGKARLTAAQASLHSLVGRPLDPSASRAAKVTFKPSTGLRVESFQVDRRSLKAKKTGSSNPSLASGRPVEHLVSVDGDSRGALIVGARLLDGGPRHDGRAALALTRFAVATESTTPNPAANTNTATRAAETIFLSESSFAYLGQPYVVAPDGRVFQPVADESGYSILVHVFADPETAVKAGELPQEASQEMSQEAGGASQEVSQ